MYFGYWPKLLGLSNDDTPNTKYSQIDRKTLLKLRREFIFDAPPEFEPVERQNIIGIDHLMKDLDNYIKLLQNYKSLGSINAELDTGVIFTGRPGSGKTYCARFIVTESKARFIDINNFPRQKARFTADDIIELFDLMKEFVSKREQPIIAFWDEFETFTNIGDDAEKIQALSTFKTELSGIKGKLRGIFIIVATNRADLIPADVARSGRLGKDIHFSALTRHAKELVLKHFVERYNHGGDIDFRSLSFLISAEFPADIEELVKEAWRTSVMDNIGAKKKTYLTNECLVKTLIRQDRGIPHDITLTDEEMRAIAIYEVGRATITRTLNYPAQIIVINRMGYADAYRIADYEHRSAHFLLKRICDNIAIGYGGIIAQEICGIEANTKQIFDFNAITNNAQNYVENLRATRISTDISISTLARARGQQNLPISVGIAEKEMYDTKHEISELIKNQQERVRLIFEHYNGQQFLEKAAKQFIDKGLMLQIDIDALLDKEFVSDSNIKPEKDKKKPGF